MIVLIVDDERVVAESMAAIFSIAGHQPTWTTTSAEALVIARQIVPQLLITDVVMPGENGIDLAMHILAEFPACKILLMSGQAETSNLLETAEEQGHHFEILAKPIWPPDLLKRAEAIVKEGDSNSEAAAASR